MDLEERRNIRMLVRVVSGFIAWPSLSIGLAMAVWDFQEHMLHIAAFLPLGAAALVTFVFADRIARRFVPDEPAPGPA